MEPSKLVVSPDVVVRFKEGRIVVHTAFRPAHLLFDSMEIVSVLAFFRCPREQREALEVFPEAPLDTLQGVGVLIPAEPPSEASGGAPMPEQPLRKLSLWRGLSIQSPVIWMLLIHQHCARSSAKAGSAWLPAFSRRLLRLTPCAASYVPAAKAMCGPNWISSASAPMWST